MRLWKSKIALLLLCFSILLPAAASAHTPATTGPAADLRAALGQLLGEHAFLAVAAMQKGYDGAPDFNSAAGALNKNTDDLTAAVASVYGKEAGDAFKTIWSSHIGYFVDYVKATAAKDEKGRQAAVANLEKYRFEQAGFFAKANPAYFKADAIADGLKMHINHLLLAFDAYVNKNYDAAYGDIRTAYAHMFLTGDALSAGIVGQFPDKFHGPADMAKTTVWMKLNSGEFRINNAVTYMDTTPFLYHESTFIPIRYLAEGLGAEVTWDNNTQTAWIKAGSDTLTFWIGKNYMEVNGMRNEIGSPVMLHGGRKSVPVRFIAELLGWDVQWNNSDRSVTLTKAMDMNH